MDVTVANQILDLAEEGQYLDEDRPADEAGLIKLAEYYFEQATGVVEEGGKDPHLTQIVKIGQSTDSPPPAQPDGPEDAPSETDDVGDSSTASAQADESPDIQGRELSVPSGAPPSQPTEFELPVPGDQREDAPQVPRDLTELSDRDIRKFSGIYQAYLSRATWLTSVKASDVSNAKHLFEHELRKATTAARQQEDVKTRGDAEDLAAQSEVVLKWEKEMMEAEDELRKLKALKEIYKDTIDRLSREASMRQDEFVRGGK